MQEYQHIAFYRDGMIGDNIITLRGIYAIKQLYPNAKLVVYTNHFGFPFLQLFDFIDVLINIKTFTGDDYENKLLENINSYHFDICILTQPTLPRCRLFAQTNCKRIITFLTGRSFLRPRFQTIFISRNFSKKSQYQRILALVRTINPKHYDSRIHSIDFSAIRLRALPHNESFVESFLSQHNLLHKPLFLINPFVHTTACNLTLQGWRTLSFKLASLYPSLHFVIPTYKHNPEFLSKDLATNISHTNIHIFCNNDDLLNLVALLQHTALLISPSTGISHIADNLNIPMIWLCSKRDSTLWRGANMDKEYFIILPQKNRQAMNAATEAKVIEQVCDLFAKWIETYKIENLK